MLFLGALCVPSVLASVSPSVIREVSVSTSVIHVPLRWFKALTNLGRLPGDSHSVRHKADGTPLNGEEGNSGREGHEDIRSLPRWFLCLSLFHSFVFCCCYWCVGQGLIVLLIYSDIILLDLMFVGGL